MQIKKNKKFKWLIKKHFKKWLLVQKKSKNLNKK